MLKKDRQRRSGDSVIRQPSDVNRLGESCTSRLTHDD